MNSIKILKQKFFFIFMGVLFYTSFGWFFIEKNHHLGHLVPDAKYDTHTEPQAPMPSTVWRIFFYEVISKLSPPSKKEENTAAGLKCPCACASI